MFVLAFFQVTQKYDQLVRGFEKNNETNKDQRFIGEKYARIVKVHSITLWKKHPWDEDWEFS